MSDLDQYCDLVLQKTQEKGGRISPMYYQQLVNDDDRYFYQVKAKLYALGLIERRDDNKIFLKIFLTPKGLKVKNIKEAERVDKPSNSWIKKGLYFLLSVVLAYYIEKYLDLLPNITEVWQSIFY